MSETSDMPATKARLESAYVIGRRMQLKPPNAKNRYGTKTGTLLLCPCSGRRRWPNRRWTFATPFRLFSARDRRCMGYVSEPYCR